MSCFDIFKTLIKENIKIRCADFTLNNPSEIKHYHIDNKRRNALLNAIDMSISIQCILNNSLFSHVFSKGLYRCELLYELLHGILYFSKRRITFRSNEHLYYTIATVIVSSQIFGDGNHRTSLFYLKKFFNVSTEKANNIVAQIELSRCNMVACPVEGDSDDVCNLYEKYISQKIF